MLSIRLLPEREEISDLEGSLKSFNIKGLILPGSNLFCFWR